MRPEFTCLYCGHEFDAPHDGSWWTPKCGVCDEDNENMIKQNKRYEGSGDIFGYDFVPSWELGRKGNKK